MSRAINGSLLSALTAASVEPYLAIKLDFDTDPVYIWSGYGDKDIDGNTYLGAGHLLGVSGLDEVNDLSAKSVTLTLSGMNDTILQMALTENYQRRSCTIKLGEMGVADTVVLFEGYMNTMSISDDGTTSNISLVVESKLINLERASNRRYTNDNHQARHAGDTFFAYVADLQDKEIIWGRENA
jgi:hypothetical protein